MRSSTICSSVLRTVTPVWAARSSARAGGLRRRAAYRAIHLEVGRDNTAAQRVYRRAGIRRHRPATAHAPARSPTTVLMPGEIVATPSLYYQAVRRCRAEAIDQQGHASNLAYVAWMQDVAIEHSAAVGWPMDRYLALGAGWVVRSHFIEYLRPVFAGERLALHTWVPRFDQRATPRRYLFVREPDGRLVAEAETKWVFVDLTSGRRRSLPRRAARGLRSPAGRAKSPRNARRRPDDRILRAGMSGEGVMHTSRSSPADSRCWRCACSSGAWPCWAGAGVATAAKLFVPLWLVAAGRTCTWASPGPAIRWPRRLRSSPSCSPSRPRWRC